MHSISIAFPFDFILAQYVLRLSGTKEIGCQLGTSHVVKNVL